MVWLIVVVAVVVLAVAAWVGTGRLGQMPEAVNDRPKGRIPAGEVDSSFLEGLSIPLAPTGYAPDEVDDYLDKVVAGVAESATEVRFRTVRRGYDMQVVDEILDRVPGAHAARRAAPEGAEDEDVDDASAEDMAGEPTAASQEPEAATDGPGGGQAKAAAQEPEMAPEEPGSARNGVDEQTGRH